MRTPDYQFWKDVEERFKFFLMLAALCGCGYLAGGQIIYILIMLLFGGIAAASTPLYQVSQEKLRDIDSLDESKVLEALEILGEANRIFNQFTTDNPGIAIKFQDLAAAGQVIRQSQNNAASSRQSYQRQREIRQQEESQRRQRWEDFAQERRVSKNLRYGEPPDPTTNNCSSYCPIRATENLKGRKREESRGIYYKPGDADYTSEASWCFESVEKAIADGFRASKKGKRR